MLRKHQPLLRSTTAAALALPCAAAALLVAPRARADGPRPADASAATDAEGARLEGPPPASIRYLQYGVAFTVELPAATDAFCTDPTQPCLLGPGGGIALHLGWRTAGKWYWGGALEVSSQDPSKLLRLALLKQARFEARYYVDVSKDTQPFAAFGVGIAGYGEEWDVATWGPTGLVGVGVETQVSTAFVASVMFGYRPMYLTHIDTPAVDGPGVVHLFALEFAVEAKILGELVRRARGPAFGPEKRSCHASSEESVG